MKSSALRSWPALAALFFALCDFASAQSLQQVATLGPLDGDGGTSLMQGADGDFYGTTEFGGNGTRGTVFRIKAATGERIILAQFSGTSALPGCVLGGRPLTRLVQDASGVLYGTTEDGGANGGVNGNGVIFKITTDGNLTILRDLTSAEGMQPQELTLGSDGNLYGAAQGGGTQFNGTVFKVSTSGAFQKLAEFDSNNAVTDGYFPRGPVARDANGIIYGTCARGGSADFSSAHGVLFKITTQLVKTTLLRFTGDSGSFKGDGPLGLRMSSGGLLYGATYAGGRNSAGTLFKCATDGTFTNITDFDHGAFFDAPGINGPPTEGSDHNFYGAATNGGLQFENGTVFQITSAGVYHELHTFGGSAAPALAFDANGGWPRGGAIMGNDGAVYGVTQYGGKLTTTNGDTDGGFGVIYRIVPTGQYPFSLLGQLESFTGSPTIAHPRGAVLVGSDGNFYGTTQAGGFFKGTVFKATANGTVSVLAKLTGTSGTAPGELPIDGLLQGSGTTLYGAAENGGTAANDGVVFSITIGGVYTPLATFSGTTAQNGSLAGLGPAGVLADDGSGNRFGTTQLGGANNLGTIYKIASDLTPSTKHEFASSEGSAVLSGLCLSGGKFYGTATAGGANGFGTIFVYTPDGAFAKLLDFTGQAGANLGKQPGVLVRGPDGTLYGTTFSGGNTGNGSGLGTVFKFTSDGTTITFTTLAKFTGTTGNTLGSFPQGPLFVASDGTIYGTTTGGGTHGYGTVFRIKPDLSFSTVYNFSGTDGNTPRSGLVAGTGGLLFGTTEYGGIGGDQGANSGAGTLFSIDPAGTPASAPTVQTLAATNITDTSALLRAQVNPQGSATTVEFFLNGNSVGTVAAGSGTASLEITKTASGLTASTAYVVRAKATNALSNGTATDGGTTNFNTLAPASTVATVTVPFGAVSGNGAGATTVPGAGTVTGIPTDATFAGFGLPAIDEAGQMAFMGKFGKPAKSAVFAWNGSVFGPLAVVGTPAPGLAFNYASFSDPALGGPGTTASGDFGRIAFLGKLTGKGISKTNNTIFVSNATPDGHPAVLARSGDALAASGPLAVYVVASIGSFVVDGSGSPCAVITLRTGSGGVKSTTNQALVRWVAGLPQFVVRTGDQPTVAGTARTVKLIAALAPAKGSTGAARGPVQSSGTGPACRVTFTDRSQAVLSDGAYVAFAAADQTIKSFDLPAGGASPAVLATLNTVKGSIGAGNNTVILGPKTGQTYPTVLAQKGSAPTEFAGFPYTTLTAPVGGDRNGVAFTATYSGLQIKAPNNRALFWVNPAGVTTRLLQIGAAIPALGVAPLASITSFALPPGPASGTSHGPIALCQLKIGRGGVASAQASVLVEYGTHGTVEKLLQTGDLLANHQTIRTMTALGAATGSLAQGRSYNASGDVVVLVTASGGASSIVKCSLP